MPFAHGVGGARIYWEAHEPVEDVGDRPPVVLIQGLGLSSRFWFDLPERIAGDAVRPYRVLVLDNRGAGRSDRPRGPYRMRDMADDVVAVLDAAGVRDAYVVGISMGGMIAQHVALRHGGRVRGLVLMATTPGLPHARLPGPRTVVMLLGVGLGARGAPKWLTRLLLPAAERHRARELFARWPAAIKEDAMTAAAFLGQLAAVLGHSTGFRLGRLDVPAIVLTGAEDVLVPPQNSARIARRLRGSVLETLPRLAHGLPRTDEEVVHRAHRKQENLAARPRDTRRGVRAWLSAFASRALGLGA